MVNIQLLILIYKLQSDISHHVHIEIFLSPVYNKYIYIIYTQYVVI